MSKTKTTIQVIKDGSEDARSRQVVTEPPQGDSSRVADNREVNGLQCEGEQPPQRSAVTTASKVLCARCVREVSAELDEIIGESTQTERQERLRKAAALIEQWMAEPGDYDERVMAFLQESPAATCPDCWANVTGHCPKCGKACASTAVTDFGKNPVIEKAAVFCESQAKYFPDSPMTRNGWLQCAQILRAATTRPDTQRSKKDE